MYNNYDDEWRSYERDLEADTWEAMTDGMYGDYPGGDVDYDDFGF